MSLRRAFVIATALAGALLAPGVTDPHATVHAASPGYTVTASTLTVHGLGHAGDANHNCTVEYDLYRPSPPVALHSAPAILFTNGFGGSKSDGAAAARYFVPRGYVVLAYSGLGFGKSTCTIELDDPDWDGRAAAQLIDFLATVPEVKLDAPGDPRVGMLGGSYGGAVQLAAASVTDKLDTIVPQITWNDLAYSLTPNNDSTSLTWTDQVPGVPKLTWAGFFFLEGLSEPFQHPTTGTALPSTLAGCPGFDPTVCLSQATTVTTGAPSRSTIDLLRHASMASYGSRVHIPTLLMQGQGDTLFNIDEAVANRARIMANGAEVKLVLQSWGHSFGGYPGDNASFADPAHPTYDELLIQRWFDHHLKGLPVDTGPGVEYYRDWVPYDNNPSSGSRYGSAPAWPIAPDQALALSGTTDLVPRTTSAAIAPALVPRAGQVATGSQTFVSTPVATSYTEIAVVQAAISALHPPALDAPGTFASWTTAPLAANLDIAGVPTLRFAVSAVPGAAAGSALPGTDPVLFAKLFDVAPDGTASLLFPRLVSPIRLGDLSHPVSMTLPGVVHRFSPGHRIRMTLAAGDLSYVNSRLPQVITVSTSAANPSMLTLPVVAGSLPAAVTATAPPAVTADPTLAGLSNTAAAPAAGIAAPAALLALLCLPLLAGRRRRTRR